MQLTPVSCIDDGMGFLKWTVHPSLVLHAGITCIGCSTCSSGMVCSRPGHVCQTGMPTISFIVLTSGITSAVAVYLPSADRVTKRRNFLPPSFTHFARHILHAKIVATKINRLDGHLVDSNDQVIACEASEPSRRRSEPPRSTMLRTSSISASGEDSPGSQSVYNVAR